MPPPSSRPWWIWRGCEPHKARSDAAAATLGPTPARGVHPAEGPDRRGSMGGGCNSGGSPGCRLAVPWPGHGGLPGRTLSRLGSRPGLPACTRSCSALGCQPRCILIRPGSPPWGAYAQLRSNVSNPLQKSVGANTLRRWARPSSSSSCTAASSLSFSRRIPGPSLWTSLVGTRSTPVRLQ